MSSTSTLFILLSDRSWNLAISAASAIARSSRTTGDTWHLADHSHHRHECGPTALEYPVLTCQGANDQRIHSWRPCSRMVLPGRGHGGHQLEGRVRGRDAGDLRMVVGGRDLDNVCSH